MPTIHFFYNNWQFWEDYPNQKVVFDGLSKTIFVAEGVTELSVSVDLYSAWKEWIIASQESPNSSAYPKAFTAIGGDPITDIQNVGVTYFLENGWRIQPYASGQSYTLTISGNLYTREVGDTPFYFAQGASVSLVRSNIVDLITVESLGVAISPADITAIADATAGSVWDEAVSSHTIAGSTGERIRKTLTKNQYLTLS